MLATLKSQPAIRSPGRMRRIALLSTLALTTACVAMQPNAVHAQVVALTPYENDTVLQGILMSTHRRDQINLCQLDCLNNPNCKGYSWVHQPANMTSTCHLFSSVTARSRARFYVSGLKTQSQSPTPVATGLLAGRWNSVAAYAGMIYDFTQDGSVFRWSRVGSTEIGNGTVSGDILQATWTGGNSGTGKIAQRSAAGDPVRIEWSNGVVMARNPPR